MENKHILNLFKKQVPKNLLQAITFGICDGWKNASKHVSSHFPKPQGKDLLPHYRRSLIETSLTDIGKWQKKIDALSQQNTAKNCSHVEIMIGNILMTVSYVDGPREMVRTALFRETLSESNQLGLFLESEELKGESYYGIIIHGPHHKYSDRPGFVKLVFPDPSYNWYLESICLFEHCNIDLNEFYPAANVEDQTQPTLRPNIVKPQKEFGSEIQKLRKNN